jgi:predicted transcriptional regulator
MITKEKLIEAIKKLPEGFTIEQVIEELVLLDKIEKGIEDIDQGKIYSSEEAENRLSKWLK